MSLSDEDAAALAIAQLERLSKPQLSAADSIARLLGNQADPFADIHQLFALFDSLYFRDLLLPRVEVSWSPRLTLCAGICELFKDSNGHFTRIRLKLSEPLLKFRRRSDTINTLLHESIHAYFFVTSSWRHSRNDDPSGHGTGFQMLASAINVHGGYEISIYHTFHDEVDSYRTHVWKCNGPCRDKPPYFGLVKRSMNRAPGKSDYWWARHESQCGGTYTKIAEPELNAKQLKALSAKARAGKQNNKIDSWVKQDSESADSKPKEASPEAGPAKVSKPKRRLSEGEDAPQKPKKIMLQCPICNALVTEKDVNEHLDSVHGT
ncbi:SprT-like family-domain-containing protein [Phyllosticta citribraziliensis]|uniref:Protein with SprT-like domain at the N terminus n=1 Tax=Phyllosticta citribraziliensis TaxID=989973 RepID=A0ABR1LLV4_9PEZI